MAKLSILAGSTSQSVNIFIGDSSVSTGAGLTNLTSATSGLTAYYSFAGANATATVLTLAPLATITTAWGTGGFKEIDATNMPGWYRLDIPNAVLVTAKGRSVGVILKGAANMIPCNLEIELTAVDNQTALWGILTTVLTESYAALHSVPTLAQAIFEMRAILAENTVTSTTVTVNKIDGSTLAETFTINSATAPTLITRAS